MIRAVHRSPAAMSRHDRLEEVRSEEVLARAASKRAGIPYLPLTGFLTSASETPPGNGIEYETGFEERVASASRQTSTIKFEDIVSPLTSNEFFELQYDCAHPLLLRGPDNRFSHLVSWREIDRLAFSAPPDVGRIRVVLDGEQLAVGQFSKTPHSTQHPLAPRAVDDRKLLSLLRKGAILRVDQAQQLLDGVLELTHALSRATYNQTAATLHASWSNGQASDAHWNDQEMFVFQVDGEKLWNVYAPTRVSPLKRDLVANHDPPKQPLWNGRLTAGDVLYLPRGWWYDVQGIADRERASVHLECALRPRTGEDFLAWLEERMTAHKLFRRELPLLADDAHWVTHVAAFRDLLDREIERGSAREWAQAFGDDCRSRWTDAGSARLAASLAPWQSPDWNRFQVRLRGFEHCRLRCIASKHENHERVVSLTANGTTIELDQRCLPLVQPLAEGRAFTVGELKAVSPDLFDDAFIDEFIQEMEERALVSTSAPG